MKKPVVQTFWLTMSANAVPKATKGQPSLKSGERAMKVQLELPAAFFDTPHISATIKVEDTGSTAPHIDVDLAGEALSTILGAEVHLTILPPDEQI